MEKGDGGSVFGLLQNGEGVRVEWMTGKKEAAGTQGAHGQEKESHTQLHL